MSLSPPRVRRQSPHSNRLADLHTTARNVTIDADGQEYAPADFQRHFIQTDATGT